MADVADFIPDLGALTIKGRHYLREGGPLIPSVCVGVSRHEELRKQITVETDLLGASSCQDALGLRRVDEALLERLSIQRAAPSRVAFLPT
jgi:hypothetical protein